MKQPHFLHVDTNSQKLKGDENIFGWAWSKKGFDQFGLWTLNELYLKNERLN